MPKRVPQYLKEISTKRSGSTEGDYDTEWGFAESPTRQEPLHGWSFLRQSYKGKDVDEGNYLGWWERNGRDVYYFGEHQRPKYFTNPESYYWEAYDWYKNTASYINSVFEVEDKFRKKLSENPDLFSLERINKAMLRSYLVNDEFLERYEVDKIKMPDHIRNIKGIYSWLNKRYEPSRAWLENWNEKAEKFNKGLCILIKKEKEEELIERENRNKAALGAELRDIHIRMSELSNNIYDLGFKVKQIKNNEEKEFSLFKSEITSIIPDQNLNVSRAEHDEDIVQLNDSIASLQKKVDMSQRNSNSRLDKQVSQLNKQNDSIIRLNKTYEDLSKKQKDFLGILGKREHYMNKSFAEHANLIAEQNEDLQDVKGELRNTNLELHETNERVKNQEENLRNTNTVIQNNSAQIASLRGDLQALGGKTKEFIDNTKRREQVVKAKVAKKESVVTRTVKKAAFPDLTKRPWLGQSVTGRFFQLVNQW